MKVVNVVQGEKEIPVEVLADAIVAISEGISRLRTGRLTEKALLILIQHAAPSVGGRYKTTPVSIKQIVAVLDGMELLKSAYIRQPVKPKSAAKESK